MFKTLIKTLVFLLLTNSLNAQKHHLSITSGKKIVGSFSPAVEQYYNWCSVGSDPTDEPIYTFAQKKSDLKAHSMTIFYAYQWLKKWKAVVGYRFNEKGFGIETTVTTKKQTLQYKSNQLYSHDGVILGVENTLIQKGRFGLGWSLFLNPDWYSYPVRDKTLKTSSLSSLVGLNIDVRLWRFISLRLNPYAEMGLTSYKKEYGILAEIPDYKPFGYGYQVGVFFSM
jgi:hypothetical protein